MNFLIVLVSLVFAAQAYPHDTKPHARHDRSTEIEKVNSNYQVLPDLASPSYEDAESLVEKMNVTCAQAIRDHEEALKEKKGDLWKYVTDNDEESHKELPFLQVIVNCGPIVLPQKFTLDNSNVDETSEKKEITHFKAMCDQAMKYYESVLKEGKKSSWKVVPENTGHFFMAPHHIEAVVNCGPILLTEFSM